jgi:hypothetical protein
MDDALAEAARRSIQDRVRALGGSLARASPTAMVVVLAGAALWPVVAPLVGTGTAAAMVSGGVGLLGGPGHDFVSSVLRRLASRRRDGSDEPVDPAELRAELERELGERLRAEGTRRRRCGRT